VPCRDEVGAVLLYCRARRPAVVTDSFEALADAARKVIAGCPWTTARTVDEYVHWVTRIRDIVPNASFSTDVIVGFCGESEAQFQRTLDLLSSLRFDKVHVAAYSPRPGTYAWRNLKDELPREEKMRRLHAVERLQKEIASEINDRLLGSTQEILVEEEKDGVLSGRTRSNKLVHFTGKAVIGDLVDVRIVETGPWSLRGAQLAVPEPAI